MKKSLFLRASVGIIAAMVLSGCGAAAASSPAPSSSTPVAPVTTGTATVSGQSETVLTTKSGMTLYYFTPDTPTHSACTGHCAVLWPPLLSSATTLQSPSGISGHFTVVKSANGNQVEYNGHFLYIFSHDKKPGQAVGQGLLGKWYVATPSLAGSTSGSKSGSGY